MSQTFRKLWKIKDLQKEACTRSSCSSSIDSLASSPAPGIDVSRLNESNNFMQLPLLNMMQMMTGDAFGR